MSRNLATSMAWRRLDFPGIVATTVLGLMMPYLTSCGGSGESPPATSAPDPAPPNPDAPPDPDPTPPDPDPDPVPPPDPADENRPPVAVDDAASTRRDVAVVIEVLANDTDPDGDPLALGPVGAAAHGVATAQADGSVRYVPAAGFEGGDTFSYTVSDGLGGTDNASVSITVLAPATQDQLLERIAAAPEGSWLQVNTNRFDSVWTPTQQRAQVDGNPFGEPSKIILAWGSMAWDRNRRQLIIWGGGHANYAGNDVYRFDAETLRWQRASLPSAVHAPFADWRFFTVDGPQNAPISSHTYDNQEFLPLADRFISFGGAAYNTGGPFLLGDGITRTGPYLWDPSRAGADMVGGATGSQVNPAVFSDVIGGQMWDNRNTVAVNGMGTNRPDRFVNGTSAYVFEQGVESILVSEGAETGGDLFRYRIVDIGNPALDEWTLIGPGLRRYSDQGAGAYDPASRIYLRTARIGSVYGIVMWNVATPGPTNDPIKFVPPDAAGQFVLSRLHGMDYDPRRKAFALWSGDGAIWHLKPPASGAAFATTGWTVVPAPVAGASAPALSSTTGVLGKWKYIVSYDVMLGLGGGTIGQVWVYKPVGWQPPPR
ncbi:MAG TPA: Ig-like domain-containing protein [Burkholderiales bacterium]|nr:Ig-like domain-containing protein [Burkholderiales bacterium]